MNEDQRQLRVQIDVLIGKPWTATQLAHYYYKSCMQISQRERLAMCREICDRGWNQGVYFLLSDAGPNKQDANLQRVIFYKLLEEVATSDGKGETVDRVLERVKTQGLLVFRSIYPEYRFLDHRRHAIEAPQLHWIIISVLKEDHRIDYNDDTWLLVVAKQLKGFGIGMDEQRSFVAALLCRKMDQSVLEDWLADATSTYPVIVASLTQLLGYAKISISDVRRFALHVARMLGPKFVKYLNDDCKLAFAGSTSDFATLPTVSTMTQVLLDSTPLPKDLVLLCIDYLW